MPLSSALSLLLTSPAPKPLVPAVKAKSAEAPPASLAPSQSAFTLTSFSSHAKETLSLANEEDQRESSTKVPGKQEKEAAEVQLAGCKHASKICYACPASWWGMRQSQELPRMFLQAPVGSLGRRAANMERNKKEAEVEGGDQQQGGRQMEGVGKDRRSHVGWRGAGCWKEDRGLAEPG